MEDVIVTTDKNMSSVEDVIVVTDKSMSTMEDVKNMSSVDDVIVTDKNMSGVEDVILTDKNMSGVEDAIVTDKNMAGVEDVIVTDKNMSSVEERVGEEENELELSQVEMPTKLQTSSPEPCYHDCQPADELVDANPSEENDDAGEIMMMTQEDKVREDEPDTNGNVSEDEPDTNGNVSEEPVSSLNASSNATANRTSEVAEEEFTSSDIFMTAETSLDWDALASRGNSSNKNQGMSRWERESLYLKFDPLISSRNNNVNNPSDRTSFIFPSVITSPPPPQKSLEINGNEEKDRGDMPPPMHPPRKVKLRKSVENNNAANTAIIHPPKPPSSHPPKPPSSHQPKPPSSHQQQKQSKKHIDHPYANKLARIAQLKKSIAEINAKFEETKKQKQKHISKMELQLKENVDEYVKMKERHEKAIIERDAGIEQRNEAKHEVACTEKLFADMLMLYENVKHATSDVEDNMAILEERCKILDKLKRNREARDQACENHAAEKFETMRRDFENTIKEKEAESLKLKAKVRMCELKTSKLESEIVHVDRESEKLRALCEDLMKN